MVESCPNASERRIDIEVGRFRLGVKGNLAASATSFKSALRSRLTSSPGYEDLVVYDDRDGQFRDRYSRGRMKVVLRQTRSGRRQVKLGSAQTRLFLSRHYGEGGLDTEKPYSKTVPTTSNRSPGQL